MNNEITNVNNDMPFLTLQHLEKVYPNGEKAVYDFNLDVNKRDFVVIVGPSGCGKSTTLRMIAGLEDITSGDIFLEGELLNYKPSKDRKMAIVFQSYALYPQMNVYENIAFPLTINTYPVAKRNARASVLHEQMQVLNGYDFSALTNLVDGVKNSSRNEKKRISELSESLRISAEAAGNLLADFDVMTADVQAYKQSLCDKFAEQKATCEQQGEKIDDEGRILDENGNVVTENRKYHSYEIRARVFEVAEKLDLVPYLDKLPKELSGGQMQRVALGRAIIKNVPVFMMDEPLSNLDAKLRLTMRSEIVKLHNRIDATTIYVTHDQTEAMTMATRIVVMSRGFVQQIGTPEEVYNLPDNIFVARFIGSPAMNIFDGDYTPDSAELSFGGLTYDLGSDFRKKHDDFYKAKIDEFSAMLDDFDVKAKEKILKILSATGEAKHDKAKSAKKVGPISRIKQWINKISKKDEQIDEFAYERSVCRHKLEQLQKFVTNPHKLIVGIRSERMKIQKAENVNGSSAILTYPTVCELLGGEYSVHFDFCGKDMVGSYDAKDKIKVSDQIAVCFDSEDMQLFDPITGDVIR